jgi:tRNA G18 (ribose-2'-O)-methylase SpoU
MINFKELLEKETVNGESPKNVHSHLQHLSVPELQELSCNDRLPWHLLCLNLTGNLNIGTMIRTSHLLGAKSAII